MATQLRPFIKSQLEREFEEFHAANPHVYEALRKLALEAKADGATMIGIKMLWEVMRWNSRAYLETDNSDHKFPNNHTAYYARLLMRQEPELKGMFKTNRVKKI